MSRTNSPLVHVVTSWHAPAAHTPGYQRQPTLTQRVHLSVLSDGAHSPAPRVSPGGNNYAKEWKHLPH